MTPLRARLEKARSGARGAQGDRTSGLRAQWQREVEQIKAGAERQGGAGHAAHAAGRGRAPGGSATAPPSSSTASIPEAEQAAQARLRSRAPVGPRGSACSGGGHRRGRGPHRVALDRHPGRQDARERGREAAAHGGAACADGSSDRTRRCAPWPTPCVAAARVSRTRAAPSGSFSVPGTHRRRQDRDRPGPGRVSLRRRAGHGAHRHERVHGEALRWPA